MPSLDTLRDELKAIDEDIRDIMRPGGCAQNVLPTDEKKKSRLEKLMAEHKQVMETMSRVRSSYAEKESG